MENKAIIKIYISKRSDFYKLYFNIEKRISYKTIEIYLEDFFFEPLDVLVLTKFIIFQKEQQCLIYVQSEGKLKDYFSVIDFATFCKTNYEAPKTITSIRSCSATPMAY